MPGAVGLGEQVVGQERADVEVLQARDRLGALGLGVAGAVGVERVRAPRRPVRSSSARGAAREDLLERVVALDGRRGRRRAPAGAA